MKQNIELIGIYNADGGLWGEVSYIVNHIVNHASCPLCDITHGMNPFGKKSWKKELSKLCIPMRTLHLNERDERMTKAMQDIAAPVILLLTPTKDHVLLDAEALQSCNGEAFALIQQINQKLAEFSKT